MFQTDANHDLDIAHQQQSYNVFKGNSGHLKLMDSIQNVSMNGPETPYYRQESDSRGKEDSDTIKPSFFKK